MSLKNLSSKKYLMIYNNYYTICLKTINIDLYFKSRTNTTTTTFNLLLTN